MSAELLTLIQTQVNANTQSNSLNQNQDSQVELEGGLFDTLINELILPDGDGDGENLELKQPELKLETLNLENHENIKKSEVDSFPKLFTFKSNNSFTRQVIDILADADKITPPEIPVNEVKATIITEEVIIDSDTLPVDKEVETLHENKVDDDDSENIIIEEEHEDSDAEPEIKNFDNVTNFAIHAEIVAAIPDAKTQLQESKPVISDVMNNPAPKMQGKIKDSDVHPKTNNKSVESKSAKTDTELNFNEVSDDVKSERNYNQNSFTGHDDSDEGEGKNKNPQSLFTPSKQSFSNGSEKKISDSSTNNITKTQNQSTRSSTQKIESHNTFQNFFEGVLNNRRTVSQTSPLPLNLRAANVNFTQSQTLRVGLVNTVRFIRADGVQKANIIVDPPALGRISVELTSNSVGVEASIKVANEQIRQLVQDQISQLRMNLSEQGVQVAEFTVDVQQDNNFGGQGQQNQSQDENRYARFTGEIESEDTEEFNIDLEEGLLYWLA